MQEDPFQSLILHAKDALAAAEISSQKFSALQLHALEAEAKAAALELQHAQAIAEAQACQQRCQHLQQQLSDSQQQLAAVQSAYASNLQQLKLANECLMQAQHEVTSLQDQSQSTTQEQLQQRKEWQEKVQQLQADLAAAHSSKDLLLQQLQQQEAQLQELLDSAAAQAAPGDASDDELPTTHCENMEALSLQHQQQQHQQQHEIDCLKIQVSRLLDDNAVLQVRNESLDQQLDVSKMELAHIQQQLAAVLQKLPDNQQQQQQALEQQREQPSMQGKLVHDKAYYKRRYIDMKERYDALKQQKKQSCSACKAVQADEQHDSGQSRLGGVKRHHDAAAAAITEATAEHDSTAGGQAEHGTSLTARGGLHVQQQVKSSRHKLHSAAKTMAAAAAAEKQHAGTVVTACTPTKGKKQQTSMTVGQPSVSTAAAAARLAAAFTPPGKKWKGSRDTHAAATAGSKAGVPHAATEVFSRGMASAAAVIAEVYDGADCSMQLAAPGKEAAVCRPPCTQHQSCEPQPQQQPQQQHQQFSSELCEPTLPFAVGCDGTQETVKLPEQLHKQHQQSRRDHSTAPSGTDSIDLPGSAVSATAGHGKTAVVTRGVKQHTRQLGFPAISKQAAAKERQQQQDVDGHSPVWRAVRGTKSAAGGVSTVRGRSRSSSTGRSSSPQAECGAQQRMRPRLEHAGAAAAAVDSGTEAPGATAAAAAAGSDSDFDCPAEPKRHNKQQQLVGMQQKMVSRRSQPASDPSRSVNAAEQEPHQQQQQQQQQAPARHGGRRRGVMPAPPLPPPPQLQEHQGVEETSQWATKQAVPVIEHPKQQLAHQWQVSKPVVPAATAAAPSRYTVVCSKPKQQASTAALLPAPAPSSCTAAPVNSTSEAGCSDPDGCTGNEKKHPGSTHDFKYQEVVRKKAAREVLNAFECEECRKFYTALQSWGAAGHMGLPTCGHAAPKATVAASVPASGATAVAHVGGGILGQQQLAVHQLVQNAGRHRAKWQPPCTPPGFWHIGFTPDHDSLEVRQ